jgi:hypothetical protein
MKSKTTFRVFVSAGAALALAATGPAAAAASVSDACPATMAEAQALLQRQGRLPGSADGYPQRYSPAGLNVLGGAPTALRVTNAPNVIWSFAYELPVSYTLGFRRVFEASPPRIAGFTHDCPADSQCRWSASGFGNSGPQPQHAIGQLLEVELRGSYSNPGSYSLACRYLNRRPVRS